MTQAGSKDHPLRGDPKPPPANLDKSKIIQTPWPRGRRFYRCADKSRPLLDWDSRPTSRFSHPLLPFPVLYLAPSKEVAFLECYGDEINDQLSDIRIVPKAKIEARQWVEFDVPALSLFDTGSTRSLRSSRTDVSSFLAHYTITQAWSGVMMDVPVDGLLYRSRHDADQFCMAIFGTDALKKEGAIPARAAGEPSEDSDFLRRLLGQNIAIQ
jgi:hypothetical protein